MIRVCDRCGIGWCEPGGGCGWCGSPRRLRLPLWIAARRSIRQSRAAAALRRLGPLWIGVGVGIAIHLLAAAIGVAFGLPRLWQTGLFWSQQWWWALLPEGLQPWLFSILSGAAYGSLAGWAATWRAGAERRVDERSEVQALRGSSVAALRRAGVFSANARHGWRRAGIPSFRLSGVKGGRAGSEALAARGESSGGDLADGLPLRSPTASVERASFVAPTPGTVTTLVAFVLSAVEQLADGQGQINLENCLVATTLGAMVGWWTMLIVSRSRDNRRRRG